MTEMRADLQDIRTWARAQGMDVAAKGKIPLTVMDKWNTREISPAEVPADEGVPAYAATGDGPESRPAPTRIKPWWKRDKKDAGKPAPRRVSIENVVSSAWSIGAMMLARNPQALPVARVLDMQAPVAGIVVNDMAKGTALDKLLQPVARAGESGEKAMALLGPPVLVGAITMNPQLYPVLRPVLKMTMMSWLEVSEPAMKKAQQRAARFEEKFGGVDIDGMIDALFAPPPGSEWAEAASQDEEDAIRRAKGEG